MDNSTCATDLPDLVPGTTLDLTEGPRLIGSFSMETVEGRGIPEGGICPSQEDDGNQPS